MKVTATFHIRNPRLGEYRVQFRCGTITVTPGGFTLDPRPLLHIEQGDWEPCVEHCLELIDLARAERTARCRQ